MGYAYIAISKARLEMRDKFVEMKTYTYKDSGYNSSLNPSSGSGYNSSPSPSYNSSQISKCMDTSLVC